MKMTAKMAQAWIEYLIRHLLVATDNLDLLRRHRHAVNELGQLWDHELVDADEYNAAALEFGQAQQTRHRELVQERFQRQHHKLPEPWFTRVRQFSGEAEPRQCRCKHQRTGTGAFFNSMGVLQCATCKHWQVIRKPVK